MPGICSVPLALFVAIGMPNGLSFAVWRVLYRAKYFIADSRHAAREKGGRVVHATPPGHALRDLRPARATGGLREFAAQPGNVRGQPDAGLGLSHSLGAGDGLGRRCRRRRIAPDIAASLGSRYQYLATASPTSAFWTSRRPLNISRLKVTGARFSTIE